MGKANAEQKKWAEQSTKVGVAAVIWAQVKANFQVQEAQQDKYSARSEPDIPAGKVRGWVGC